MPEGFNPIPGLLVVAGAISLGLAMSQWGGRRGRYYAMPAAGTLVIFGLDWFYSIPLYAYLAGILFAPLLFHRSLKAKLLRSSKKIPELELAGLGIKLKWTAARDERVLARWEAHELAHAPDIAPEGLSPLRQGSIIAEAPGVDLARATAGPHTLVVSLGFTGEGEDDYEVTLSGEGPKLLQVAMIIHHKEALGPFTGALQRAETVDGVPGMEDWMTIRSDPRGYAYHVLDFNAFELLHRIFDLQKENRELYVLIEGNTIRVGSTRTFTEDELRALLGASAPFIQKMRDLSWTYEGAG